MKLGSLLVTLLLSGLFIIALVNVGIILAENNDSNYTIADDKQLINYASSLNSTLEDVYTDINSSMTTTELSPVSTQKDSPIIDSLTGVWKTLKTTPSLIYNLTSKYLFSKIFGDESYAIVFSVIIAIVTLTLIFAIYKFVTQGEG